MFCFRFNKYALNFNKTKQKAIGLSAESHEINHYLDFLKENTVTQLGYPPLRIDLLTAISGLNFDEAFGKKVIGEIDRLKINFINIEDFKANKLATGRPKDLGDLESLNSI